MWIRKTFPLRRVRREILWKFLSSSQCLFTNPNFPFTMLMLSMLASRASLLNVERGKKRRGKLMILPLEIKTITLVFWNYFSFLPHVEVECYERCLWGGCSSSVIALHVIRVHMRIRNVEHHRQLPDVITHGIIYKTIHQQINFPYFLIKRFSKIFRRRRQRTEKTLFFWFINLGGRWQAFWN